MDASVRSEPRAEPPSPRRRENCAAWGQPQQEASRDAADVTRRRPCAGLFQCQGRRDLPPALRGESAGEIPRQTSSRPSGVDDVFAPCFEPLCLVDACVTLPHLQGKPRPTGILDSQASPGLLQCTWERISTSSRPGGEQSDVTDLLPNHYSL